MAERATDAPQIEGGGEDTRTELAAERTWLAWWRTGIAATAAAIGIGRLAPELAGGRDWPYVAIGAGYGVLAVAIVVLAAVRERALRHGAKALPTSWLAGLTAAGALLAFGALAVVLASA